MLCSPQRTVTGNRASGLLVQEHPERHRCAACGLAHPLKHVPYLESILSARLLYGTREECSDPLQLLVCYINFAAHPTSGTKVGYEYHQNSASCIPFSHCSHDGSRGAPRICRGNAIPHPQRHSKALLSLVVSLAVAVAPSTSQQAPEAASVAAGLLDSSDLDSQRTTAPEFV